MTTFLSDTNAKISDTLLASHGNHTKKAEFDHLLSPTGWKLYKRFLKILEFTNVSFTKTKSLADTV